MGQFESGINKWANQYIDKKTDTLGKELFNYCGDEECDPDKIIDLTKEFNSWAKMSACGDEALYELLRIHLADTGDGLVVFQGEEINTDPIIDLGEDDEFLGKK